jgi:HD-GYP domain-containing protein (c-di-GMP phosphodiesterase class II)
MYEALAAQRPYRKDLTQEEVMTILARNSGDGICPVVFAALKTYLAGGGYVPEKVAA